MICDCQYADGKRFLLTFLHTDPFSGKVLPDPDSDYLYDYRDNAPLSLSHQTNQINPYLRCQMLPKCITDIFLLLSNIVFHWKLYLQASQVRIFYNYSYFTYFPILKNIPYLFNFSRISGHCFS